MKANITFLYVDKEKLSVEKLKERPSIIPIASYLNKFNFFDVEEDNGLFYHHIDVEIKFNSFTELAIIINILNPIDLYFERDFNKHDVREIILALNELLFINKLNLVEEHLKRKAIEEGKDVNELFKDYLAMVKKRGVLIHRNREKH